MTVSLRAAAWAVALALVAAAPHDAPAQDAADAALQAMIAGPQRSPQNTRRDVFRHPYEVLRFFGLKDDQTVVEVLPGGRLAYWTEILAPYLRERGKYIAALPDDAARNEESRGLNAAFKAKLAEQPALYDRVVTTAFGADRHEIAPAGSVDMVLTFRNLHNWMRAREQDAVLRTFFRVLKPGGILGVVEHRGRTDLPQDPEAASGYVRADYAIALAEKAGFEFIGSSEVNANPRDTKTYPAGVWTLPPTYRLGDVDRSVYEAIGESDRFVMKFVKPGG